ncbi:ATP synthase mitochondrial F1 complex assembly factor 2 [Sporothrix curviconia]|uniref:ATP synthase mitochondrial F1 complex assembly factor 2 n=1 Tax=Sporothrix curviconia TaxID=1260050 RepID=A0ABP0CEB9_9PEZI
MRSVARIRLSGAAAAPARSAQQAPALSQCAARAAQQLSSSSSFSSSLRSRPFHSSAAIASPRPTSSLLADVVPLYGQGPPPNPPTVTETDTSSTTKKSSKSAQNDLVRDAEERSIRIARRRAQAEKTSSAGGNRFWKTASVAEADGQLQVRLDTRPLRHPATKKIIELPPQKQMLAHALAAEWDQLTSVRQAAQAHRMPLMSLVCRALDLEAERVAGADSQQPLRKALVENILRYLDTDSLLCWAPPDEASPLHGMGDRAATREVPGHGEVTLRQLQERTAGPILAYLSAHVWPGVVVEPVLGGEDQESLLFPKPHPPETRAAVGAWLETLNGWDLAGVERATLAGKSMVVATRIVAGWSPTASETAATLPKESGSALSVEEAYAATNMETAFQTAQWGEVEDTHDVEREDMRRHFGSVVLLVS